MKTSRERILNARIDSIVGSTDYRVPEGYYLKKLIVSSDSAGDTITVTLDGVLLCTVTATTALSQYEALINYDSLNKGSFLLNIAPRTGTGTAYIEISNEKPVVRSIGDFVHYPLTADQYAAIANAASPSAANPFATGGDLSSAHAQNTDTGTESVAFIIAKDSLGGELVVGYTGNDDGYDLIISNDILTDTQTIMFPDDSGTVCLDEGTPKTTFQLDNANDGCSIAQGFGDVVKVQTSLGGLADFAAERIGVGIDDPVCALEFDGTLDTLVKSRRNTDTESAGYDLMVKAGGSTYGIVATVAVSDGGTLHYIGEELSLDTINGGAAAVLTVETVGATGAVKVYAVTAGHAGTGYATSDEVYITGGNDDFVASVATVDENGAVLTFAPINSGTGYEVGTGNATTTDGEGTGLQIDITSIFSSVETVSVTDGGSMYEAGFYTASSGSDDVTIEVLSVASAEDKDGGDLILSGGESSGTGVSGVKIYGYGGGVAGKDDATTYKVIEVEANTLGFFSTAPVAKQAAMTTQLQTITHSAPGTTDYAIADPTQTSPWGFTSSDEVLTLLSVIANLQTRVQELENKLVAYGLLGSR